MTPSDAPETDSSWIVRRAGPDDALVLAALGERTFREAWAAFNDPAEMDAYCAECFSLGAVEADLASGAAQYLVAERDGGTVGYLRTTASVPPDCVSARRPAEISRVYVLRQWHGSGVADALMKAGLDALAAAGHDAAWLAVWQQAPRAQAFYRRWGFETVGTTTFRLHRDLQDDFVMQRPLTPGARVESPSP